MPDALLKLTDPAFFAEGDPHALWQQLRAEDPVAWTPETDGRGFWSITRYDDGIRVFKDWSTFSSARGTTLEGNGWEDDPAGGKMLALMDPPRHTQVRHLLTPFFTPRRVSALEAGVQEYVSALVLRCSALGRFDFVEEIASRLPVGVFFTLLDIPAADWESLFHILIRTLSESEAERYVADAEMLLYLSELAAARRARPGEDLLSVIATMRPDGQHLSDEEVVLNFANVISAGIYTTRLATSGGLHALIQRPEHWGLLQKNRDLIPLAVEEIVRWTSPALALYRTATKDACVGERTIARNDRVVVWIPSLNRDAGAFARPDTFDVTRNPNRHLGFGVGGHACIGAAFARLELRLLFQEVLTKWRAVESAGEVHRLHSLVLHGIDSLPVSVELP